MLGAAAGELCLLVAGCWLLVWRASPTGRHAQRANQRGDEPGKSGHAHECAPTSQRSVIQTHTAPPPSPTTGLLPTQNPRRKCAPAPGDYTAFIANFYLWAGLGGLRARGNSRGNEYEGTRRNSAPPRVEAARSREAHGENEYDGGNSAQCRSRTKKPEGAWEEVERTSEKPEFQDPLIWIR